MSNSKVAEIITNKFLESITKEQKLPWQCPWKQFRPGNAVSGKAYRGVNAVITSLFGKDIDFMTYNQAKQNGGNVRQGAKGLPVTYYNFVDSKTQTDKNGKARKIPFLRYYTVFNLSDIDGCEQLKAKLAEKRKGIEFNPIEACEKFTNVFTTTHGGNEAYYSPGIHAITMPPKEHFASVNYYYKTLFHEIGHACAREVGEDVQNGFGSDPYAKEELVAELFANFCLSYCNIDSTDLFDNSTAYLQNWIKRFQQDPTLLLSAATKASKRFDWLLAECNLVDEITKTDENEAVEVEA